MDVATASSSMFPPFFPSSVVYIMKGVKGIHLPRIGNGLSTRQCVALTSHDQQQQQQPHAYFMSASLNMKIRL
jgi:hypothetical protein